MTIIQIKPLIGTNYHPIQSQSHRDGNWMGEGWACVPSELEEKLMSLYPYIILTVNDGIVTAVADDTVARKAWEESQSKTPVEQRKSAYAALACIPWEGEQITVDNANELWMAYSAEGSPKVGQLSALIEYAKHKIRAMYPDATA